MTRKELLLTLFISTWISGKAAASTGPESAHHHDLSIRSCNFHLTDRFNGTLSTPSPENNFGFAGYEASIPTNGKSRTFGFSFECIDDVTKFNKAAINYGAIYDARKRQWKPYFGDASSEDQRLLRSVTTVSPLRAVNGQGFYMTQDSVNGEPSQRKRWLSYCVFHDTQAICGIGQVMALSDPKGNMLPYALTVLKSITFLTPTPAERTVHAIGDCRIRIGLPYGGTFAASSYGWPRAGTYMPARSPGDPDWSVTLRCVDARYTDNTDVDWLRARQHDGRWQHIVGIDKWEEFSPEQQMEAIPLQGEHWHGWAIAANERAVASTESGGRMLRYCLWHGEHALCGAMQVSYPNHPEINVQDKVVNVLKTVRFVDPIPRPNPMELRSK